MGRDKIVRHALRDRFVFTLRNGESFDGLLLEADEKTYLLGDAVALDGKTRVRVDGQLYLARDEVLYLQKPGVTA